MKKELNGNAIKKFLKEKGFEVKVQSSGGMIPSFTIEMIKSPYKMFEKTERYNTMFKKNEVVDMPSENYRITQAAVNKFIVDNGGRANSFHFKFSK